jgi:O-antigen/teichoic acid export membrane protein
LTEETPDSRSYARRLVKGSAIVFAAGIASEIIGVFLRMFLARSLTVAEYGLFYAVFALVSFFFLFRDLGLVNALVKYIPEFEVRKQFGRIKSSMAVTLLFKAVFAFSVSVVLFILSDQIALAVFKTVEASLVIKILSIWFSTAIFLPLFQAAFLGFQNMRAYASMSFLEIFFVFLSVILLVGLFGLGIEGAASAYLLASLVMAVLGFALFWRGYPRVIREKVQITKPLIKKLFLFALPVFIGGIGGMIIGYMDTLMIAAFRTLPEVGFYQAAQPIAYILWIFVGALTTVLFPMVSELWARRKRGLLGGALYFLIKFSFTLIIPAALVLIAFPDIIIRLLFGEGYLAGATALQILGGTAIVYTLFAILTSAMSGIGRPVVNTKVVGAMACLNLVGNSLLIPPYGIEGAAIATLCSFLLGVFILFHYAKKFVEFTIPTSSLFKTLVGGILTLLLIFSLKFVIILPPWPEAFAVMVPSLLFYGAWILATKAITKDDLRLIARIVPMPRWLARIAMRFVGE